MRWLSVWHKNDASVPYDYNGYTYQTIYQEGKDFPIYQRKPIGSDGEWKFLLMVMNELKDMSFIN